LGGRGDKLYLGAESWTTQNVLNKKFYCAAIIDTTRIRLDPQIGTTDLVPIIDLACVD
jgi:hypothetical protein